MSEAVKKYTNCKDSGVPWLGQVPAHWSIGPGFSILHEKKEKNTGTVEDTVLSLSYGRIVVKPPEKLHGLVPASFETYQIVDPNDIIIRPTDLQNDWNSLRVGLARDRGIITSAYMCLRAIGPCTPEYGYLLLHAYDLKKIFYGMGSGLRQNLDYSDLKRMPVLIPPADEQRAIARFLDHHDRLTRRYIRAQRRLIALLEEQKQALIQRTVTRGLDPNVPLKDSNIEWVGHIPEHWIIQRLKYIVPDVTVGIVIQPARLYVERGVPCLRSLNISSGEIDTKDLVYISAKSNEQNRKSQIYAGDIVVVRTGQAGVAVVVPSEFDGANCIDLLVIRRSRQIISEYLLAYLNSYAAHCDVEYRSVGAIQAHYNVGALANMSIPLPSIVEQEAILQYLDSQMKPLSIAIEGAQSQIDLVREYRTRLIADVVTGKLDVRDVVLPELDADDDALDDVEDLDEDSPEDADKEDAADADHGYE